MILIVIILYIYTYVYTCIHIYIYMCVTTILQYRNNGAVLNGLDLKQGRSRV